MPDRTKQQYLADPHLSYKTVRYGNKPITHKVSSVNDQSTLSQFGFRPTTNVERKKRNSVSYKRSGGTKRKSLDFDELEYESSESEEGDQVGKRRRVGQHLSDDEDDKGNGAIEEELEEDSFVVDDQFDGDDGDSWRPRPSPKRRKSLPKPKFYKPKTKDRTLTQMYPRTHIPSESEYEEDENDEYEENESQEEDMPVHMEDIQIKDEPLSQADYEPEMRIKEEPLSQAELSGYRVKNQQLKQEDEGIRMCGLSEGSDEEILAGEVIEEPVIAASPEASGLSNDPKTPKRPIPTVVPSSYTPPVTPLSPLRHQQLSAILASPSIQHQWRMSGRKLPGFTIPDLSPVTEHQGNVDNSSTEESTPVEAEVSMQPPRRPDFTKDDSEIDARSEKSPEGKTPKGPDHIKPKIVQSTQWWEREETFTSNSSNVLEPIQEVDSQPKVQVRSSDVQIYTMTSGISTAQQIVTTADIEMVPESPVRRKGSNTSFKTSSSTSMSREPLLRDSSGLHTINTSFFRKESSTMGPPGVIENESQQSEVSIKSVDRQLINESHDYNKASADKVEETQLNTDELDPDATISQSQSKEQEITSRALVRWPSLLARKSSHIPLLPPSSPPQNYKFAGNINSTPPSSKDIFHSPSRKISSSPILGFKNTLETFEPQGQEEEEEGSNEAIDTSGSYPGKRSVETLTQWKIRMFGPSQAVPTISQILGANSSAVGVEDDDDDDDDDEEL